MAHILAAESVRVAYPAMTVLDGVTIGIGDGDRIGVVGRNGDGKSTLLSVLAGQLEPHAGQLNRRSGAYVGTLDQVDRLPAEQTLREVLRGATTIGHTGDAHLGHEDADWLWAAQPRTRDVIDGLLRDLDLDRPVSSLSGGQRRRVSLARLLLGEPDVIMLDEPTNHLDLEGVTWLAEHLKRRWSARAGALMVVTHDRWFLDEVCTTTWEVHDGQVEPFDGGYAAWILQRAERARISASTEAKRQNLVRKELAWLRRGAPARTSKPKFRIEAANQLIDDVPPVRDSVELSRLATARLGKDVLELDQASVAFGDHRVLDGVDWQIGPGDRFALLGANGAGKTTLLNLITDARQPDSGRVKRGKTVKVATLSQHLAELDPLADERVSDVIGRSRTAYVVGGRELTPGQLLERLGFSSAQLSTLVRELSGGQRRRLQLLLVLLDEPNVLVLDEPTNDMDTDMLAAMEDLLDTWPGTLVVASHDRYLMERVTDHQYALFDGHLRHLPGGVDQYLELVRTERAPAARSTPTTTDVARADASAGADTRSSGELRVLRKQVQTLERRMERLHADVAALHASMAVHDPTDYPGLATLDERLRTTQTELDTVEADWLDAAGTLE